MDNSIPWYNFVIGTAFFTSIVWLVGTDVVRRLREGQATRVEAGRITREAEHKEREEKKLRDQQLNHGRRVFNWLKKELKHLEESGLVLHKLDQNGASFSIFVTHEHVTKEFRAPILRTPILQITYDFVDHTEPYLGHVHYGAYGADGRFYVNPKGRVDDASLRQFVVREIEAYFESRSHI